LAERHRCQLLQHGASELARQPQVDVEIEVAALALEVLVELAPRRIGRPRRAKNAGAEAVRELLELRLRIGIVGDRAEAALGDGNEQLADRRIDDVVGDVEQTLGSGGGAEARIELG
jgi:hypothetical protein